MNHPLQHINSDPANRLPSPADNAVYLISADGPGCGSSSLAQGLEAQLNLQGAEVHAVAIGAALRAALGVTDEAGMQRALRKINDPHKFDPQFYGDLPADRPCVIEGKLATTVGPQYVDPAERPVVSIDLTCPPLITARRILQREGLPLPTMLRTPDGHSRLLETMQQVQARATHDKGLRKKITAEQAVDGVITHAFDTSQTFTPELIERVAGTANFENEVPQWELDAVKETMANLASLQVLLSDKIHPIDMTHYEHQFGRMRYCLDRMSVILDPTGLASVREDLKNAIIDCWFGLMMKEAPRFFSDAQNEIIIDHESQAWTPEFYKIAEAWPILSNRLKGKSILDPFAGAGTLMNFLIARGVPSSVVMSDIAYPGGMPVDNAGHLYEPKLNGEMARLLFDNLPSWYKPDFSPLRGYITASANRLPMRDQSVDFIVADPPYGKNCASGGIGLLLGSISEFKRVAREGSLLLVPTEWVKEIKAAGHKIRQLTTDVSRGHSKLPVCYILVEND